MFELQEDANDWRGVVALVVERALLALARELGAVDSGLAGTLHGILGLGFNVGTRHGAVRTHSAVRTAPLCVRTAPWKRVAANCYASAGDYRGCSAQT